MRPHIHFCTPCYGGQVTEPYFSSFIRLQALLTHHQINFSLSTVTTESLITRGRNTLVAFFMANPDATHLMFIDADIRFDAESVLKLLRADKDVIAGVYPKKGLNWARIKENAPKSSPENLKLYGSQYAVNVLPEANPQGDLLEVRDVGTGFLMIKKTAIEKLAAAHPELHYRDNLNLEPRLHPHLFALFDTTIDAEGNYLSEDYTFCRRWRKLGEKIWIDTSINLDHVGNYTFNGNIQAIS
jgi:hypothetical protein